MPVELQSRLLRVLEDGMIRPVGADRARKVDVRIVAATHQPLEERVREGRFREDLEADGQAALPWQIFDPTLDNFEFLADLVVTDYRMPLVDGLELLAAVRRGRRQIPVILVSACADASLLQLAASLGAAVVLAKPFSLTALIAAVRAAHAEHASQALAESDPP